MELQYFIWIAGVCYSFCPTLKCQCHYHKLKRYKLTRTGGVAFDAISGVWVFLGNLPTNATHSAQNGIVLRELKEIDGVERTLSSYPFQIWCKYLVAGKPCARPIVRLKQLRKGHFATLDLCAEHRVQHLRDKASKYYSNNRKRVLEKRRADYLRRKELEGGSSVVEANSRPSGAVLV